MKRVVAALLLSAAPAMAHDGIYPATLERVVDGDTFRAHVQLGMDVVLFSQPLRIAGIDAPEIRGRCPSEVEKAALARNRLQDLLGDGGFMIAHAGRSKFGERLVHVFSRHGNVGDMLVAEHLAHPYAGGEKNGWCQ